MDGPTVDADAPERRLHPWSWLFVLLQQLKQFIFPLIALLVFGARKSDDGDPWLAFAPVIGIAVLVVLAILQYFTYRYVIGRDGLTVREMGDETVHPASEQTEESGRALAGSSLTCRLGYRRHRPSPSFKRQTDAAGATAARRLHLPMI